MNTHNEAVAQIDEAETQAAKAVIYSENLYGDDANEIIRIQVYLAVAYEALQKAKNMAENLQP